jgi:ABC-type spermidine/putrescine transport system permease subunit II
MVGRTAVRLLLVTGLLPGVMTGKLVAIAAAPFPALGDGPWALLAAHVARFGWIGAVGGVLLARGEGAARDLRRLDGARGLSAWIRACLPAHRGALLATGVVTGMLALHEIEASIVVQPPGLTSMAQTMLGFLHYSRMDELGVGVTLLGGVATAAAGLLAWAARPAR